SASSVRVVSCWPVIACQKVTSQGSMPVEASAAAEALVASLEAAAEAVSEEAVDEPLPPQAVRAVRPSAAARPRAVTCFNFMLFLLLFVVSFVSHTSGRVSPLFRWR